MKRNGKSTYCGWSNYQTWAVNLWLTNDAASYSYWSGCAQEVATGSEEERERENAIWVLAEVLRNEIEEQCSIGRACLAADLLSAALEDVDWCEIAQSFVDDFAPQERSDRAERDEEQAATTTYMLNPLSEMSGEFVEHYPLTKEEVRLLAVHWATLDVDTSVFCVLHNTVGTTDLAVWRYTGARLKFAAAILGDDEMESVDIEAEKRIREKIGDEFWTAYKERRPLAAEQIEAEQEAKRAVERGWLRRVMTSLPIPRIL